MNIDHEKLWYTKNFLSTALLPLSWLFRAIVVLRRKFYRLRNSNNTDLPAFTIVVGNVTVGGVGKTPFVIWLAKRCKAQGLGVGIVTRGYKRKNKNKLIEVQPQSLPEEVGDEAILLALKSTCPVLVSADRKQAVEVLVKQHQVDVVVSDDGLQHYNMPRNIEIAVVDADRKFGNGRCLPAGPLREPVKRLDSCDIVVSNGHIKNNELSFDLSIDEVVSLSSDTVRKPIEDFKDFTVNAVAGIGNPARFFTMLRNFGIHVLEHKFPDHHLYQETDLEFENSDPILMTEKDAVKCKKFTSKDIWYLPVSLEPSYALEQRISKLIKGIPHG